LLSRAPGTSLDIIDLEPPAAAVHFLHGQVAPAQFERQIECKVVVDGTASQTSAAMCTGKVPITSSPGRRMAFETVIDG